MKISKPILLLLLLSICTLGHGQTDSMKVDSVKIKQPARKNVLKFLPENLVFNSLSFEYERKFSPKSSFLIGVGLPSPKSFAGMFNLSSADNKISNDEFSSMALRLAYRHYAGHRIRPTGFYYSPYLKYQSFAVKADNYRTSTVGTTRKSYNENYDVSGNSLSLGLQWGVQFMIAKRVCFDFYFLGIEAGLANLTANVKSQDIGMIDTVESDLRDNVKNLPSMFADKVTVTRKGTDQVEVKGSSIPFPMLRSGMSIGIAF